MAKASLRGMGGEDGRCEEEGGEGAIEGTGEGREGEGDEGNADDGERGGGGLDIPKARDGNREQRKTEPINITL